ncbi:ParB/RepB/Spo0J family partition protein [Kitasatospora kifunensis]|uniref:ParB/RepB/Spo0J family partition protein n=1 Tax=Kitasatospora kifunensis TaxID=58351 RepID=A0A7W7RBY4_KITKI|nr:ParB N-terminal domain-containing protein [Kitasatospora kifunensis]MBB4929166.1 ParB/RepB/Spo0J family partition protein [Kitasatospora kifunensis]
MPPKTKIYRTPLNQPTPTEATKPKPVASIKVITSLKGVSSAKDSLYQDGVRPGDTVELDLDTLCPSPFNRREMKGVEELAASIEQVGLIHNISFIPADVWLAEYPDTKDKITTPNVLLVGEHRWRAFQLLERKSIPAVLRSDQVGEARLIILIENVRRSQLSILEEAEIYRELQDSGKSLAQIAKEVGETAKGALSKGTVSKRLKLLSLDPQLLDALREGKLRTSAAEHLADLSTPAQQKAALALVLSGMNAIEACNTILTAPQAEEPVDAAEGVEPAVEPAAGDSTEGQIPAQPSGSGAPARSTEPKAAKTSKAPAGGKSSAVAGLVSSRSRAEEVMERERREASADRDAACQRLVENLDVMAAESQDDLLRVFAVAALLPPQQAPAQQRAFRWLQALGRNNGHANAAAFFDAVGKSPDEKEVRAAAFASALAACELRTAGRRQTWGPREVGHVQFLIDVAQYKPETAWELRQVGLSAGGVQ